MAVEIDIVGCPAVSRGTMVGMRENYPIYVGLIADLPVGLTIERMFLHPEDMRVVRNSAVELGVVT